MARLALLAAVATILVACGSGGEGARPKRDGGGRGDPYVTRAQVRRIRIGMSATLLHVRPNGVSRVSPATHRAIG